MNSPTQSAGHDQAWGELIGLAEQSEPRPPQGMCSGICVTAADIGVGSSAHVVYPHPMCPQHGDSEHPYREARTHELHTGQMGVCECGVHRDDHVLFITEPQPQSDDLRPQAASLQHR
ncbi:hypothetical protein LG293_15915 (plasmid) [Citricoccus nitrophenolicus]